MFRYVESEKSFQQRIENGRVSGYTTDSFARSVNLLPVGRTFSDGCSLTADFVHHGNKMRLMEKFIDSVYTSMFVQAEPTPLVYMLNVKQ